jgi:hypothetical protein
MSFTFAAHDVDGAPLTYALVSGSFESGVSFNAGVLSGTPTNPNQGHDATYPFVVSVSNGPFTVNRSFSVTFSNVNLPPVWVTPAGSLGEQNGGTNFSTTLHATDPQSYALTYAVSAGALPAGLSLSPSGVISGLLTPPPAFGPGILYSFTVLANNGFLTSPQNFTIKVDSVPDIGPYWNTPAGSIGSVYSGFGFGPFQLSATDPDNGPSPLSYFLATGSNLPGAIAVSGTGVVSGTAPVVSTTTTYNFNLGVSDGLIEADRGFSITVLQTPHGSQEFLSSGTFTVPAGVTNVNFDWIIAGGGAGGAGHENGNGGGGGGGGSGGYYTNYAVAVSPGDVLSVTIGGYGGYQLPSGGNSGPIVPEYNGLPGGDTYVQRNGTEVVRATGGGGGEASPNNGGGYLYASAGVGGTPNGVTGSEGYPGNNDHASGGGADGAPGPYPGSSPGIGGYQTGNPVAGGYGSDGVGYGSSGGGGGFSDRNYPYRRHGGNGVVGYAHLTY